MEHTMILFPRKISHGTCNDFICVEFGHYQETRGSHEGVVEPDCEGDGRATGTP
jgi:hypothetical protein